MSPLSVAKVTSNLASGSISKAGALGMAVLRYRPCQRSSEPLDARERRELCDLFEELGPDAPTLCEGWTTDDLAAHLVVRERNPTAGPGILLGGRFAAHTERLMEKAKAAGYRAPGRPGPQRPAVRAVRGARAAHADQPPGVRGAPRGRAPGQRARAAHRPSRPPGRPVGHPAPRQPGFLLRKVHGATVRLQRPGRRRDHDRPRPRGRGHRRAGRAAALPVRPRRGGRRWRSPATPTRRPILGRARHAASERSAGRRRGRGCGGR